MVESFIFSKILSSANHGHLDCSSDSTNGNQAFMTTYYILDSSINCPLFYEEVQ